MAYSVTALAPWSDRACTDILGDVAPAINPHYTPNLSFCLLQAQLCVVLHSDFLDRVHLSGYLSVLVSYKNFFQAQLSGRELRRKHLSHFIRNDKPSTTTNQQLRRHLQRNYFLKWKTGLLFIRQRWVNYGPQGSHTYIDSTYLESMLK